ncbi:MAG: methionine biosynthesis protein MetW [Kiloniellales bacterium]|nr:methionine biosynthesis protein MetW [Kiloniellales bacterium]
MSPLDATTARQGAKIRADLQIIADMVDARARVLDIGCSDGALLDYLTRFKQVKGRGIELSQEGVNSCVGHGLSVIQGDADTDLFDYPDGAFDFVILSQTLQATRDPRVVLEQLVRIGDHAIVSFPNFGHWRVRRALLLGGRMPVTSALPEKWYETPNIHLCTIRDFLALCTDVGVTVERFLSLDDRGCPKPTTSLWRANLTGQHGMFLLRRG